MRFNFLFTLAFSALGLAAILQKRQTPPPPGETYVTARPACNITGFTQTPVRHNFQCVFSGAYLGAGKLYRDNLQGVGCDA